MQLQVDNAIRPMACSVVLALLPCRVWASVKLSLGSGSVQGLVSSPAGEAQPPGRTNANSLGWLSRLLTVKWHEWQRGWVLRGGLRKRLG